jgi:CRP-like cAMP-binding protein
MADRALECCPRIRLRAGEAAGVAGQLLGTKLYLVEWGFVLVVDGRSGSCRPIVISLVGEGAVLPPLRPEEELVGLSDAVVVAVSADVTDVLLGSPPVAGALVEGLLDGLHDRQESVANANGGRHDERLLGKLCQLARVYGRVGQHGIELDLPLTHELLARMIGSARETVTGTLSQFQREGLVVRSGRGYRIQVAPAVLDKAPLARRQRRTSTV